MKAENRSKWNDIGKRGHSKGKETGINEVEDR